MPSVFFAAEELEHALLHRSRVEYEQVVQNFLDLVIPRSLIQDWVYEILVQVHYEVS